MRAQWPEEIAIALARAYPAYWVTVRRDGGEPRYQLISKTDAYPYCLISPDPDEIGAVLEGADARTTGPLPKRDLKQSNVLAGANVISCENAMNLL